MPSKRQGKQLNKGVRRASVRRTIKKFAQRNRNRKEGELIEIFEPYPPKYKEITLVGGWDIGGIANLKKRQIWN